jgi:RHS repeat-associated protein
VYKVPAAGLEIDRNKLTLGRREYELANHLGNVLAVVSDAKLPAAKVLSHTDYYAFGSAMAGRTGTPGGGSYRYGFNGVERDNATSAEAHDYGARIYNPAIGRWLSVDAYAASYPDQSHYGHALNSPIRFRDEGGHWITDKDGRPIYTVKARVWEDNADGSEKRLAEVRIYYTNDGQEVQTLKYLGPVYKATDIDIAGRTKPFAQELRHLEQGTDAETYDCHAQTCFQGENYLPGYVNNNTEPNAEKIFFNKAEYAKVKKKDIVTGDVAVFRTTISPISHSATRNADGTYTSKDDRDPLRINATIADMKKNWGGLVGHYRHLGNQRSARQEEERRAAKAQGKAERQAAREAKRN